MFTIDYDSAGVSNPQIAPQRNSPEQSGIPQGSGFPQIFLDSGPITPVVFCLDEYGTVFAYSEPVFTADAKDTETDMKLMDYPAGNRENGFSLIELLCAVGIFIVVLTAISSVFMIQRKSYNVQEQVAEMTQGARSAMDMLSTEIRLAGYRLPDGGFGMPYSTSQLQLFADLKGNGDTSDPNENIIYTYDSANLRINRNDVNTEDVAYPFAENVQGYTVKYFEGDGVTEVLSTDDNSKIRQIEIKIVVRSSEPDPDYSTNNGYRSYTLTSRITPVNLDL